ncbi:MAG: 2-oxoglutarate dehydrogenase complex dihydrolipoyllysine-residue succinyltransferase [Myxococcota bacterium]
MAIELKVPQVGESITEVEIGEWLKGAGDSVRSDDAIVMIETDKVTVELPAPVSGTVSKILKRQGDVAAVGETIGYMEEGSLGEAKSPKQDTSAAETEKSSKSATANGSDNASTPSGSKRVMPAAKRALAQEGLQAGDVEGTGPGGRVLKEDVQRHTAPAAQASLQGTVKTEGNTLDQSRGQEEIVPMSSMRRRVAERLVQAQQNAALLTTFNEIDMGEVVALRKQYKESFLEKHSVKLGFMSFFVKAVVDALKTYPALNAEIRNTDIVYRNYFDIGVAVGGGKGLVVPVLRRAERMSFAEIEKTIGDFSKRAKAGSLKLNELQGGTFTITNGGVYGSLMSTPIINPPQSGIVGLHAIQDRAVVRDGQVTVRPMMYVALTYDHRIVDGREAVGFLVSIKESIEQPSRMLLEV